MIKIWENSFSFSKENKITFCKHFIILNWMKLEKLLYVMKEQKIYKK